MKHVKSKKISTGDYNTFFTCVALYGLQSISAYAICSKCSGMRNQKHSLNDLFDKFVHSVSTKNNNIKKHFRKKFFQHFYVGWIRDKQASSYKPTNHKILAQEEI